MSAIAFFILWLVLAGLAVFLSFNLVKEQRVQFIAAAGSFVAVLLRGGPS